jgi:hypothetical protein
MTDADELTRLRAERDAADDEREDAQAAAKDFAKALNEMLDTEDPDWWRLASEALARHPEYTT